MEDKGYHKHEVARALLLPLYFGFNSSTQLIQFCSSPPE